MPLQQTSGAASYDAFGGGVPFAANYIEEVFSTWLYAGNGSTQTINNGVDLAGKGGLVWLKQRSGTSRNHFLFDTARGALNALSSNTTTASTSTANSLTAFNVGGFSLGTFSDTNASSQTYASWTFREQPKFFDVVTYTGTGSARTVAHNLGSVPGCIIVKRTDTGGTNWAVYHRSNNGGSNPQNFSLFLNTTDASFSAGYWNNTEPTSTVFSLGVAGTVNESGGTYVAYLFAHNAGGFGLSGTDNVISCGSYSGTSATQQISLGFEPQWILVKDALAAGTDWIIIDNMRGMSTTSAGANVDRALRANAAIAEYDSSDFGATATGFIPGGDVNNNGNTYIYIAIRRGPMRTPTTGTSVFAPVTYTGTNVDNRLVNTGIVTDMAFVRQRNSTTSTGMRVADRLRGDPYLSTGATAAEVADPDSFMTPTLGVGNSFSAMNGFGVGNDDAAQVNRNTVSHVAEAFARAPGFFDEVCYTGTGTGNPRALNHNLTVVPELIIVKRRSDTQPWYVYGNALGVNNYLELNTNRVLNPDGPAGTFTPATSTTFCPEDGLGLNNASPTYVAYLFATCPGVSKVGSYTGNGSSQTIDCGFAGGARFVMVKRTDSTGNWMVVDTARGLVSASDPTLYLNSTAAEVTNVDWLDPDNSGFIVNQESTMNANVSSATYIYLAIS